MSIRERGYNGEEKEKVKDGKNGKGKKYKRNYRSQSKMVKGQDLIT